MGSADFDLDYPDDQRVHVAAVIYVSRDNHKGMVIGKGGATIRDVGTEARADLERLAALFPKCTCHKAQLGECGRKSPSQGHDTGVGQARVVAHA